MDRDPGPTFSLHPESGWLLLDGAELPLQHKAQEVLAMLVRNAPARVSRDDLIDALWDGNYLTGDKGVRQAIWAIRLALGDNAAEPAFIRTIPRAGYQWMGGSLAPRGSSKPAYTLTSRRSLGAFALTALVLALTTSDWSPKSLIGPSVEPRVARAELHNNSVIVDYTTGCKAVFVPDDHDLLVGSPIISADRRQVVFRVQKNGDCRMISFEPEHKRVRRYDRCPDVRT